MPYLFAGKRSAHAKGLRFASFFRVGGTELEPKSSTMSMLARTPQNVACMGLRKGLVSGSSAAETVDLVREAQVFNPEIKCCLALNRKIANTAIGRDVREALKELDVPILKSDIGQRVAFAENAASGTTVLDQKRSNAAKEIKKFVNELSGFA